MTQLNFKLTILVAIIAILEVGCGNSNSGLSGANVTTPNVSTEVPSAPVGSTIDSTTSQTNTVDFSPVSIEEFNSYVAMHALNSPNSFKLTVALTHAGSNRYAGSVKISYQDTGYQYEGKFEAGSGTNQDLYKLRDAGLMEAQYNHWFIIDGKYYFSAFFQDAYGAIVLVFDNYVNQGDAQGSGLVSGSVYYKNFAQSYAQQSPYRKCWFLYNGPYDCRATSVINKSSIYPGDGYRKLGTFSGLSLAAALK